MEIYSLFDTFTTILPNFAFNKASFFANYTNLYLTAIIAAVGIWLTLFIVQGVGLFRMAKRQNLRHKWLAFMPFANVMYMGKLAGECSLFGHKMKRAGLYAMIAQIISTLVVFSIIAAESYLYMFRSEYLVEKTYIQGGVEYIKSEFSGLVGFDNTIERYLQYVSYFLMVIELVYKVLLLVLIMGLFRKYTPKSYLLLSLISLFVPEVRFVTILVLSGRQPIDYEAYMRARREEYARRQQEYHNPRYNNPYGNPYNNPNNNPYGNPYNNPYNQQNPYQPPQPPQEPFAEFGGKAAKDDDPFGGEFDSDTPKNDGEDDGFFN